MIHFSANEWNNVKKSFDNWWDKKSPCAVVGGIVESYEPSGKVPSKPLLNQNNVHLNFTPDEILDAIEYELSKYEFFGDAFPMFNMDCFGPGVVAAFLGCEMDNNNGTTGVWFHPRAKLDIAEFNPVYDSENPVLRRIKAIYKRAVERFEGKILLSMPDLGGVADVLSSFFPGEELMYEMYDNPDYVTTAIKRIDTLWQKFYDEFAKDLNCSAYGYTDWSRIYSSKPSYIIQSDITYMLSHDMYKDFVKDSVLTHTKNLERTIFHLDGTGELKNLDDLLTVKDLDAIQWVPGSNGGKSTYFEWLDVYNKILDADKLVQVAWASFDDLENIVKNVDKKGYIQQSMAVYPKDQRDYVIKSIDKIKSL